MNELELAYKRFSGLKFAVLTLIGTTGWTGTPKN